MALRTPVLTLVLTLVLMAILPPLLLLILPPLLQLLMLLLMPMGRWTMGHCQPLSLRVSLFGARAGGGGVMKFRNDREGVSARFAGVECSPKTYGEGFRFFDPRHSALQ